jgi:hypothetical protein
MAPLTVDPVALSGAGAAVIAAGDGIAAALGALTFGLGANTGQDHAGEVFGLAYQDAAEAVLKSVAAGINACRSNGFKLQLGASNYSNAEAASTPGGGGAVLPSPPEPGKFDAPGPPWTLGPGMPEPALWAIVEAFVTDLWPNGLPAQMHTAAGNWRTLGAALHGVKDTLRGPISVVEAQQIPEGARVQLAFSELGDDIAKIGDECHQVAKSLDDFANQVQQTQDAIRDLLHRLGTASGLWHEVVQVFQGHGLDEVKRIADDIKIVLKSLMREAKAGEQILQQAIPMLDGLVVGLQTFVRGELTHYLGDDVGNPLATAFDVYTNIGEAAVKTIVGPVLAIEQLDPVRFFYDPNGALASWKGVAEMALLADPATAQLVNAFDPQFEAKLGRQLLHLDDWRADRPGLGAAENAFDVLMLAIGVGEVGAASRAADAAGAASRAADAAGAAGEAGDAAEGAGAIGRTLGEVGEAADAGAALSDIGKTAGGLTKDLDGVGGDLPKIDAPSGGRPDALPPPRPGEQPIGPPPPVESAPTTSLPRDSAPPVSPRPPADPPPGSAPAAPEPGAVPSEQPVQAPGAPGEYRPSTTPEPTGQAPAQAPLPEYGAPAGPAPTPGFAEGEPHPAPIADTSPGDVPHFPADDHPPEPPKGGAAGDPGGGGPTAYSPEPPQSLGPGGHPPQPPHDAAPSRPGDEHVAHPAQDSGDNGHPGSNSVGPYQLPDPKLVTPPPDGAFFWSGRTSDGIGIGPQSAGGNGSADLFAASHGGTTLEGLLERNGVKPPLFDFTDAASQEWWSKVSGMYAENVRGEVHAVVGSNLRPGSVWETVELPRLIDNPNVTKIVVIDPETGLEKTIYQR